MSTLNKSSRVSFSNGPSGSIPLLGFGTYLCSTEEAKNCVLLAFKAGYRHIDTAEFYNNHEGIAQAIALSGLPREEIFITDKIRYVCLLLTEWL
jgi:diketogulonate reductase-like aldo/keto reductase